LIIFATLPAIFQPWPGQQTADRLDSDGEIGSPWDHSGKISRGRLKLVASKGVRTLLAPEG